MIDWFAEGTTEAPSDGNSTCPETKPDQGVYVCPSAFRKDPKDCNMFYQCTESEDSDDMTITKFSCPPNTSYNEKECKCDKSQSCSSDSSRSLKYLIEPRNMVISNKQRNVNNTACQLIWLTNFPIEIWFNFTWFHIIPQCFRFFFVRFCLFVDGGLRDHLI